ERTKRTRVVAALNSEVNQCLACDSNSARSRICVAVVGANCLTGGIRILRKWYQRNLIEVCLSVEACALAAYIRHCSDRIAQEFVLYIQMTLLDIRPHCFSWNRVYATWKMVHITSSSFVLDIF